MALSPVALRMEGLATLQVKGLAGRQVQCSTRPVTSGGIPGVVSQTSSISSQKAFADSLSRRPRTSRKYSNQRLKVRANAEDADFSPRHLDRRHRKDWLEGQQSIQDRLQGFFCGGNWILRRGSKSKATKSGEALTDTRSWEGIQKRDVLDGGADLAEYRWTGPAEKSLLDLATNGGQWEPLQINLSPVSTEKEAELGNAAAEAKPVESAKEGQHWKLLIGLFFAFCLMTSADKAAMSVAPMSMAKQFGWLESDKGLIGSAFFFGFMFSQIPSSIVCKRIGRRKIMTGVALWIAACQLLTPIAASTSLTGLLAVRAALGFGEGVVVPILTSMLADYIPAEKRSSSLALVFSGGPLGTVLSLFLCPHVLHTVGWQPLFYSIGAVSLAWGLAWSSAAPHFEPLHPPKPRWNPFKRSAPKTAPPTTKLYRDSPLLLETGVKLATLATLGPDGKRHPEMPPVVARPDSDAMLAGSLALMSDDDEVLFSPDDPYWKLSLDARRKLRQRRIAIRGRFQQSASPVSSPRKINNGIALPIPHSAQQSLSGSTHVTTPPSAGDVSPVSAESVLAAVRERVGTLHLRPLRSTGTICSSSAVSDALPAGAPPASEAIPWRRFFSSRAFWAIAGAHFCSNWGWNAFMAWLPTYFTQKLGMDLAASSTITLIPWMVAFLAGNTSGMLADWMSSLGIHKTKVRKIIQAIAFLGPATGLALLTRVSTATEAVVLFCGVLALGSFSAGGFCSNHADISPKHSGTLYALTNTVGCLGGSASVALTGILLDKTGNWNIVWLGAALMYVIGTLWYVSLGSTEKEFE